MPNYRLIQDLLGVDEHSLFKPMEDPQYLFCIQDPDVIIGVSTAETRPGYFQEIPDFLPAMKMGATSLKRWDDYVWVPAVGHYFTSEDDTLDLWVILEDSGTDWSVAVLAGANVAESAIQLIDKADLLDKYAHVIFADDLVDDSSGSGSFSSSGSSSI